MLAISGALVTIDAMGCQKEIARKIRGRAADYVLAVKDNHERLFEQVVAFWDGACARLMKGPDIGYHREWSEGHGRNEARRCWATSDLAWLEGREEWEGLQSVVLIESRAVHRRLAERGDALLHQQPAEDAGAADGAIRSHWGIEIPQSEDPRSDNLCVAGRPGYHRRGGPARAGRVVRPASGPRSQLMLIEESDRRPPRPRLPRRSD